MNNTQAIEEAVSAVQDLENVGFQLILNNDDHLENARKFVACAFSGKRVVDLRTPEPKPEWKSGGQRSSGSVGQFLRSRERVLWNSIEKDEETGKFIGLTHRIYPTIPGTKVADPVVKSKFKAMARELSKKHGMSLHSTKMVLLGKLAENLAEDNQNAF